MMSNEGTMSKYKLVIFDFDGTLANTFPWFCSAINIAAQKYGFRQVAPDEIEKLRGMDARSIMLFLRVPWWKVPWIARFMRRHMAKHLEGIQLFSGVERMLEQISHQGVTMTIVSSNSLENVQRILTPDCARYITNFYCGASLFKKHAKFQKLIKQGQFSQREVLCIGDEQRDLEAAQKLGIDFGAVTWGYAHVENLHRAGAQHIFDRIEDISLLLRK